MGYIQIEEFKLDYTIENGFININHKHPKYETELYQIKL